MSVESSQFSKAPPLGTKLAARYELLRFLGSGAIGAVYEAATPSGERVALKVLLEIDKSDLGKELAVRFVREARVASTLDSEHIVPVIDSGMDDALHIPYLVMPLLSGFDLETMLERVGSLHPTVAARIVAQACKGLAVAHRGNVVHRDIKPGNLFLDHETSGKVTVRVLDFGLAKMTAADEQITRAGSMMGTPHYMSPEQSTNAKDVDERADVWSVGATLYHALTGCAPFDEKRSFADLHLAINSEAITPVQDRAPWVDPGLATLVHGALLRDRAMRCPSMKELLAALIPYTLNSSDLSAMMLEPVPAVLRTMPAKRAKTIDLWEPSAPSSKVPALPSEQVDPLLGRKLDKRYALLRSLGRGAGGGMYEAQGPDANRFAVRVVDPKTAQSDPAASRRFVREARALVSIESPHVNKLVDACFDEELAQPFVVLELLHGLDLRQLVDKHGPIEPRVAVPLMIQAARGVQAAHDHGVVHRAIHPPNIFLVEQPSGEVTTKLIGFGMVKRLGPDADHDLTRGGEVIGSMLHMSPEQARNAKNADERSDVWGLGATLFHALAGVPPWPTELAGGDLLLKIGTGRPYHLQDKAPWVRQGLAEVVHRALTLDPAGRYRTATELADALVPFTLLNSVQLAELGPLPSDLRARIEDRADVADAEEEERLSSVDLGPVEPAPASVAVDAKTHALERRRKAQRTTWLLVVAIGLITVAAVAGYVGWGMTP